MTNILFLFIYFNKILAPILFYAKPQLKTFSSYKTVTTAPYKLCFYSGKRLKVPSKL